VLSGRSRSISGTASIAAMSDRLLTAIFCFPPF
jgi:hypothetical protein